MRLGIAFAVLAFCSATVLAEKPNVIIFFADDLGYGDLSCYGQTGYKTPNLDRLASEGIRLTSFMSASSGCSPSRASLLTGSYPQRVGVPTVLGPNSKIGLNPAELTIADLTRAEGYRTAIVGKWHLGVTPKLMPLAHGFDEYFGLPYSNDMWPFYGKNWPELPLFKNNTIVEKVLDQAAQDELTVRYTQYAVDFIDRSKDGSFFLYLPYSMPHVPLAVSSRFAGKSGAGMYGDVIQEMDWSVGQIIAKLRAEGLDKNTLVFFTSDNGPWLPYGNHSGVTGGLREGKGTTFEGGMRMPGIAWWPGRIPPGQVSGELATTMDILPTVAQLLDVALPSDRVIDGKSIWPILAGKPGAKTPHKYFFYTIWPGTIEAVRSGKWKLHVPHPHRHQEGAPGNDRARAGEVTAHIGLSLFDLENDLFETTNVAEENPEIVARLLKLINAGRRDMGDAREKVKGWNVRSPGRVD